MSVNYAYNNDGAVIFKGNHYYALYQYLIYLPWDNYDGLFICPQT